MSSAYERAQLIQLVITDIDGVCTDGNLHINGDGEVFKSFNSQDGLGIKLLQKMGIHVGVITARQSASVQYRMQHLGVIDHVYMGYENKRGAYDQLLNDLQLAPHQVAYIGDDLPDLPLIIQSGLGICVHDAYTLLHNHADWRTQSPGGCGAVREVCDFILQAQNKWDEAIASYF